MATPNTLELTDDNFDQEVLASDVPVLVDFWADWCAPCRAMTPAIDGVADAFAGRARVGKLDVDRNPETAAAHDVRSIPTLLVFRNGAVVDRFVGITDEQTLARALDAA